jgi:hypothetical protein
MLSNTYLKQYHLTMLLYLANTQQYFAWQYARPTGPNKLE